MALKDIIAQFLGQPATLSELEKAKAALAQQEQADADEMARHAGHILAAGEPGRRVRELEAKVAGEIAAVQNRAAADEIVKFQADKDAWWSRVCAEVAKGKAILKQSPRFDTESQLECVILQNLFFNEDELPKRFADSAERNRMLAETVLAGDTKLPKDESMTVIETKAEPTQPVEALTLFSVVKPIVYTHAHSGKRHAIHRGGNVYLTAAQAELALDRSLVVKWDARDPRQQQNRSATGSLIVDPAQLYDLDADRAPDFSPAGMRTLRKAPLHTKFNKEETFSPMPGRLNKAPTVAEAARSNKKGKAS
jgi:hypothetical protein